MSYMAMMDAEISHRLREYKHKVMDAIDRTRMDEKSRHNLKLKLRGLP